MHEKSLSLWKDEATYLLGCGMKNASRDDSDNTTRQEEYTGRQKLKYDSYFSHLMEDLKYDNDEELDYTAHLEELSNWYSHPIVDIMNDWAKGFFDHAGKTNLGQRATRILWKN